MREESTLDSSIPVEGIKSIVHKVLLARGCFEDLVGDCHFFRHLDGGGVDEKLVKALE